MNEQPPRARRRRTRWTGWVVIVAFLVGIGAAWRWFMAGPSIPGGSVVVFDLGSYAPERDKGTLTDLFGSPDLDLVALRGLLECAAQDERVAGVCLRVSRTMCGMARVEDLRGLIAEFRRSGKPVVSYADGADTLGYLLAAAGDRILVDRSSSLDLTGLRLTAPFLGEFFSRLGVEVDLVRMGGQGVTLEQLSAGAPSQAFTEASDALLSALYDSLVEEVARSRGLEASKVRELIDRAPLAPSVAVEESLADDVMFRDELEGRIESAVGQNVNLVPAETYALAVFPQPAARCRAAFVEVRGLLVECSTGIAPLPFASTSAEDIVRSLQRAESDPEICGVVLRIDSPGGTLSAAEKVWHQVQRTAGVKPVVASLGDHGAAGGYYAACAADWVTARPGSLSGGIGVVRGKVVWKELLSDHGVRTVRLERGASAGLDAPMRRYDPYERRRIAEELESSYRLFVSRVARGRSTTVESIDRIAHGRIWSGRQAVDVGLVDDLRGLSGAVLKLRELASVPAAERLELLRFSHAASISDLLHPERRGPFVRKVTTALESHTAPGSPQQWLSLLDQSKWSGPLLDGRSRLSLIPILCRIR